MKKGRIKTSTKIVDQEKIMKRKMVAALFIAFAALLTMLIFIGLYTDEKKKTQAAYRQQYIENMTDAANEINIYLDKGKDYQLHYNLILSDMGAARSLIFLIDDYSEDDKKAVNELHYCFVKYPEQMSQKLEEAAKALEDVTDNLDKGYDEIKAIVDSIDKLGS